MNQEKAITLSLRRELATKEKQFKISKNIEKKVVIKIDSNKSDAYVNSDMIKSVEFHNAVIPEIKKTSLGVEANKKSFDEKMPLPSIDPTFTKKVSKCQLAIRLDMEIQNNGNNNRNAFRKTLLNCNMPARRFLRQTISVLPSMKLSELSCNRVDSKPPVLPPIELHPQQVIKKIEHIVTLKKTLKPKCSRYR